MCLLVSDTGADMVQVAADDTGTVPVELEACRGSSCWSEEKDKTFALGTCMRVLSPESTIPSIRRLYNFNIQCTCNTSLRDVFVHVRMRAQDMPQLQRELS